MKVNIPRITSTMRSAKSSSIPVGSVAESAPIYSGTKDTTAVWTGQIEPVPSGGDVAIVSGQTVPIFIGFTDELYAEPTEWFDADLVDAFKVSVRGNRYIHLFKINI